ncbi:MAG: 50S ribosomal protein L7/L12 [Chlamydiae bacterium RIFCSPHIGHO2_12_FULL_27_8]|nr:MAG: 50S ribosomal protein L7/L12 [Chlamydiae bacterium RIFCSPHIGHO2_12_FULL_27_8]OGN65384.1 MAG: 50S ribosomal protein L7/L12 [Chlamydiae bacterium RIFCSPLOWO2_01_FULL_28_7]
MATVNIEDIANTLSNLPVLELAKLKTLLEEKWGVKAQAAMPQMAAAPQAGKAQEAQEESTEFQVTLEEAPADKKIGVIKVVREITGLGLKEAKDLVEAAPKVLKATAPKAEAEEIVKKIQAAGGKASSKGL